MSETLGSGLEWTAEDGEVLARFLKTQAGRKLAATLRGECAAHNEQAVFAAEAGADRALYMCGRARGYRDAYAWFEALSAVETISAGAGAGEASQTGADPFGDGSSLEHLFP